MKIINFQHSVVDLGGGWGVRTPSQLWNLKKSLIVLNFFFFFFCQKMQYAHERKLKPPLHKKSRSAPGIACLYSYKGKMGSRQLATTSISHSIGIPSMNITTIINVLLQQGEVSFLGISVEGTTNKMKHYEQL